MKSGILMIVIPMTALIRTNASLNSFRSVDLMIPIDDSATFVPIVHQFRISMLGTVEASYLPSRFRDSGLSFVPTNQGFILVPNWGFNRFNTVVPMAFEIELMRGCVMRFRQ